MKKIVFSIFIILTLAIILQGCKKDEVIELLPNMSATVDGTSWEATPSVVTGKKYSNYFSFLGYNLNGNKILIVVKNESTTVTTGTYSISLNPFNSDSTLNLPELATYGVYMQDKDDDEEASTNYYSTSGSVIISSVDESRINGTFSFSAINNNLEAIEITNGKFSNVKIHD